jgi:TPR repeat protein
MGKNFMHRWFGHQPPPGANPVPLSSEQPAQNGDAETQYQQGLKYATAEGPARDYTQAAAWYRKAAEQNHGLAQLNLGQMFASGQGVDRDATQSLFWFLRAAHLGIAGAQFNMGRICQRASMNGSPADAHDARIEAYMWYELAAAQHYSAAVGAYAQLTIKMTRDEVAEARRRVVAWMQEPHSSPETVTTGHVS